MGPGELEDIVTAYGESRVKRDIVIQDASGNFPMNLFEPNLKLFENGQIRNAVLKKKKGGTFIGINTDTEVANIPSIQGLAVVKAFIDAVEIRMDGFDSIREIQLYYTCPSCKKTMPLLDAKAAWIQCPTPDCQTQTRARKLNLQASTQVKFQDSEDREVWATIFPDVLGELLGKVTCAKEVDDCLKSLEDFTVLLRKNVIKAITFGEVSTNKDKDPSGTTSQKENQEVNPEESVDPSGKTDEKQNQEENQGSE